VFVLAYFHPFHPFPPKNENEKEKERKNNNDDAKHHANIHISINICVCVCMCVVVVVVVVSLFSLIFRFLLLLMSDVGRGGLGFFVWSYFIVSFQKSSLYLSFLLSGLFLMDLAKQRWLFFFF